MNNFPIAAKRPHFLTQHGITREDEYYWMRNREDPEVRAYLLAENEYLERQLAHLKPLRDELFEEMKGRIKETDSTVPEKNGAYYYYKRTEAGTQYPIYCRKKGTLDAPEEVLLDQNELAKGHEFCSVSAFAVSPDGMKLAYSVDLEGAEIYSIYVKDLANGSLYPEKIEGVLGNYYFPIGVEWTQDSRSFYYIVLDESFRAYKLFRHILGADVKDDVLILHEQDETYSLSMFKSRSEKFIMTYQYSTLSQEMGFLAADDPQAELKIIQPRQPGLEYYATHHGDSFFIVTNHQAPNYRLMQAPISSPGMEHWQEVLPHRPDVMLEYVDAFEDHLVLYERKGGLKQVRISAVNAVDQGRYISFPDPTYEVVPETNPEYKTKKLRIRYSSLITPVSIVEYDMDTDTWELMKEDEIPSGYDKTQYSTEYIHASTADGKLVPMSIVYKKGLARDGSNPAMLYWYGAYGGSSEASFNLNLFSLLDRGFVFAIGHVRGGSELGREWYDDGRLHHKKNSFSDFIACAEHLIGQGYTSPKKLSIIGSSAGGLLVGACMIQRPDLFKAVICKVPFLDVVTDMGDPSIPLTTLEYDQWGNAEDQEAFEYMLSYSPYDNIQAVEYPHLLLTTGFNDPRVAYWEPAKFLARLRDRKTGDNLAMLSTNFSAGHAGSSGRYDFLQENVLDFAFLIDTLINKNSRSA